MFDDIHTQLGDNFFSKVVSTLFKEKLAEEISVLVAFVFAQQFNCSEAHLVLILCLLLINPKQAQFIFDLLHDELMTSALSNDNDISVYSIDVTLTVMKFLNLEANADEIRSSLHALVDFCFNYSGHEMNDTFTRKNAQIKCMRFLNQLEPLPIFNDILLDLVEKMDFDDFGNDELAQFINDVRGET